MIIFLLSICSGILGRLGGSVKTWIRDWVCPLIALITLWLMIGFVLSYWWIYLLIYVLMGLSLTTYFDWLLKEDNLWFSGYACGLALLPLVLIGIPSWIILTRATVLAVIWGCLNKYLPSAGVSGDKRILFWRRDVVEEFLRYFSIPLTLLFLLMR